MTDKFLTVGDTLPKGLKVEVESGEKVDLGQWQGKRFILYFYPKDDTPGCTQQACDFRDNLTDFSDVGWEVVGVSPDSAESHRRFKAKHSLPFTLIADTDRKLSTLLGVYREMNKYGRMVWGIQRSTFLIGPE